MGRHHRLASQFTGGRIARSDGYRTPLPGDVNQDGHLTSSDVDELCLAIASGRNDAIFDLNQDRRVTREDLDQLLAEGFQTGPGDVNLDGIFNSSDFVQVFQAGQYEDGRPFNSALDHG